MQCVLLLQVLLALLHQRSLPLPLLFAFLLELDHLLVGFLQLHCLLLLSDIFGLLEPRMERFLSILLSLDLMV